MSTDVSLKIILKGVNDINPQFTGTPYTTTLPENLNVDGFVYEASWLDLDILDEASNIQSVVCSIVGKTVFILQFRYFVQDKWKKKMLCSSSSKYHIVISFFLYATLIFSASFTDKVVMIVYNHDMNV